MKHPRRQFSPREAAAPHHFLLLPITLSLVLTAVWVMPPNHAFEGLAQYNWLHLALESVAIIIAGMVFGVAWNAYSRERPGNIMILACGLLAVGIIDFVHALSYAGMPALVTPSGPEKAINFWLAARFVFAVTLALVSLRSWKPLSRPSLRYLLLAASLLLASLVIWIGLHHQDLLPRTFTADEGLTDFKIAVEAVTIVLLIFPAVVFLLNVRQSQTYDAADLFSASVIAILSGLCFTLYSDVTDIFNLLGHIFKAISYFFIYRAVFVGSVREPFKRMVMAEAEARYKVALTNSHVTAFEQNLDLRYVWVLNPPSGLTLDAIIGKRDRDILKAGDAAPLEAIKTAVIDSGKPVRQEVCITHDDGLLYYYDMHVEPNIDQNGRITGVFGTAIDITERKRVEEELQLASLVYKNSSEAMVVTGADNRIISVNAAFEKITGYSAREVIGENPKILQSGRHGNDYYHAFWQALDATGSWKGEFWNRSKNGEIFAVLTAINTIFHPDGSVHRRVALFSDITKKKKADELIWQQANFDALTGLPNRRMFHERLSQEMRKARRAKLPLALMFLDLDGFKSVNDSLGHDIGDLLLKSTAERISRCIRETDTVARVGGDEFIVILSDLPDPGNVERIAGSILRVLSEPFLLEKEQAHVSASIGITLYPQDAAEIAGLIRNADQAMYAAKLEGKSRFHYFTQAMQQETEARVRLANEMRYALQGGQFRMMYQPVVELATGAIHKAESLIRWQHPTHGLISPAEFLSIAEDTRLIVAFGSWAFREAAAQAVRWRAMFDPHFLIGVNLSPVQFHHEGIDTAEWFHYLRSIDLPASALVLEITEELLLKANARVDDQLLALRNAGAKLALDDFGTGHALLPDLQRFGIAFIKIDRTLVHKLAAGSDQLALCEAIIVMAHQLGIKAIAEGVETEQQRDLLVAAGCDYAQGYLFAGAMSAPEMEEMLKASGNADAEWPALAGILQSAQQLLSFRGDSSKSTAATILNASDAGSSFARG